MIRLLPLLVLLTGCEIAPSHVESSDVDDALARGHYKTMCVGLDMKSDDVRRYTTERFETIADFEPPPPEGVEAGRACICDNIIDDQGRIDLAVAEGMKGTGRDDIVQCLADVLKDPAVPKRKEGVVALVNTSAKAGRDALAQFAASDPDAEVRTRAIKAIAGNAEYKDVLLKLATDPDDAVRAEATAGLSRFEDAATLEVLNKLAREDSSGDVRGAALQALKAAKADGADELICKAMMDDESGTVRTRAVLAFRGTKRAEAVKCLRNRAMTQEDDSSVRGALLTALKSSPSQDAADVLCDAIPSWVKWYGKDDMPDVVPNADIIKAQNDRDWENSYACLQRAYSRRGGYSCFGQRYVGWWYEQVGGSAFVPKCPPKYPD